ncbi:hypothetical protein QJS04_geneDACA014865 [Acorus gramineus]|uniref:RNase H type-1 domain-containing protein n=1 Tax=Acorus gramineus TaxID=55184 RepID=A0AAV9BRX7_ACOGR|nr:hypothetical protein QJS04_geneDACA014865 [Acorus gramineus]
MSTIFGMHFIEKSTSIQEVRWLFPSPGWLKANSDGFVSDDHFGYGALIRDHHEDSFEALSARTRASSINLLDLKGVVAVIKLSIVHGASKVWSESDSITAISWSQGRGSIPWYSFRDLRELHNLVGQLQLWKISHVLREGNNAADYLAAAQSEIGVTRIRPEQVNDEFLEHLSDDKVGKVQLRRS